MLESGFSDTKYLAATSDNHSTYHGYSDLVEKAKPIDYIFVNGYISEVKSYKVDTEKLNGIYSSDHHPVIAEITLINGGK